MYSYGKLIISFIVAATLCLLPATRQEGARQPHAEEKVSQITTNNEATQQLSNLAVTLNATAWDPEGDYFTPQQFGAVADGKTDDQAAFRKLFKAAFEEGQKSLKDPGDTWVHCKPIYIPSGTYYIGGTIVDHALGTIPAMFEVSGAGRECTRIIFGGDVAFDDQNVFGFSTFRDIQFEGNNENVFMNIRDAGGFGVQRLQFISCKFNRWKTIINTIDSTVNLSEITFAFCRIVGGGVKDDPSKDCRMFVLNCAQSVNWRFEETDIEGFYGDVFYFAKCGSVSLVGGSIIPFGRGCIFNFDLEIPGERANSYSGGPNGNAPQVLCTGSRFEIRNNSTLIKSNCAQKDAVNATFRSCGLGTESNPSTQYIVLNGALNVLFDNCYDCGKLAVAGKDVTGDRRTEPKLKFVNCGGLSVDYLVKNSSFPANTLMVNNCHVTVDDKYDFYLSDHNYARTLIGLHECRQPVKLAQGEDVWDSVTLSTKTVSNGKAYTTKPYGFVKYVEVTIAENPTYGDKYPVTMTLRDNGEQIGEKIQLTFEESRTHVIVVNDYVEELQVEFENSNATAPSVVMVMEVVKY
ncbi:MAG: hypothetical protein IK081_03450 [Lachnospiraceae bacterium]|nr:hypothetical protein [Lachnospiraceae bacterium]